MKTRLIITVIIAVAAFVLPILLFFTLPTDSDAGPMMAYNFFYFFPISLLSGILSVVVLFRIKSTQSGYLTKIMLFLLTTPSILLISSIGYRMYRTANTDYSYLDKMEIHNNSEKVIVNDSLYVDIHGFTKIVSDDGQKKTMIKKANFIPYIYNCYSFKDGGVLTGDFESFDLFYAVKNDTLFVYGSGANFEYFNITRVPLPIKFIASDSLRTNLGNLTHFNWKPIR